MIRRTERTSEEFVIVDRDGRRRLPIRMKSGNEYQFLVRDIGGQTKVFFDRIEDVVRAVVWEGKTVETWTPGKKSSSGVSLQPYARYSSHYEISERLLPVVAGSANRPARTFTTNVVESGSSSGGDRHSKRQALDSFLFKAALSELESDPKCAQCTRTEKTALAKARLGQGIYRRGVEKLWEGCALTGEKCKALLVASHAKPWKDSSNAERLDPHNGLLLTANLDRLFDRGLIAFDEEGFLHKSKQLPPSAASVSGIATGSRLRKVPEGCVPYLDVHLNTRFER